MSVFSLSSVAGLLGKDTRTLRRWCIAGAVPGAVVSRGGHWHIEARDLKAAARKAQAGVKGKIKTRTRLRHHNGSAISSAHKAKARNRFAASNLKYLTIHTTHAEILDSFPEDLDEIERLGLDKIAAAWGVDPKDLLPNSVFDSDLWKSDKRGVAALAWLMARPEDPLKSVKQIAAYYDMNVRTFYRRLGHQLRGARDFSKIILSRKRESNHGKIYDEKGNADFVPLDLPTHATEEEMRRWSLQAK